MRPVSDRDAWKRRRAGTKGTARPKDPGGDRTRGVVRASGAPHAPAMLALQVVLSTLLMASIPVWVRAAEGASSFVIGICRLSVALALTAAVFGKRANFMTAMGTPGTTEGTTQTADRGEQPAPVPRWVLPAIGVLFGTHWLTYFEAIQRSSASLALLALCTYGIHVTWMGAVFSKRRPSLADWAGVLLCAAGAVVCLPSPSVDRGAFVGFTFGLASAVCYAALPLLHQRIASVSHTQRAAGQFSFAWLLLLPAAPFQGWTLPAATWLILLALGVLCTFVAHNLWIAITTQVRPATSGILYYLTIPVTLTLEALVLGHPPSTPQWVGAALIVAGSTAAFLLRSDRGATE